eukprot:g5493.t1
MLARTGRQAHTPKPGLALLRAGSPRPAVQHLYRSEEVGLGQAMGLAEDGGGSDLDSGISEWASGDDGDTAAFEELLEKEARAARRNTETRNEGVQCSGPPVDQGVQTSALRLPRKTFATKDRILDVKLPLEAHIDQQAQDTRVETVKRVLTAENRQQRSAETDSTGMATAEAPQVHVRIGLEGMQDTGRGQNPTIWAVARREDSSGVGPVMMLPLEGGGGEKSSVRRFLKVTDFTDGRASTGHGDFCTNRWQDETDAGPSVADSGEGEEHEEEQEEQQQQWQTSHLDTLWESLGSLGERIAGIIEIFQREAQEEADKAAKDLAGSLARRAACPAKNSSGPAPQVRSRSRIDTTDLLDFDGEDIVRIVSPSIKQTLLSADCGTYRVGGDGDGVIPTEEVAIQAEEELREARAILQSIEEELRPDTSNSKTPCLSARPTSAGPVLVAASPAVSESVEEAEDPNTIPPPAATPARLTPGRGKHANPKHFQRPRFQSTPASGSARKSQAASSSCMRRSRYRSKESSRLWHVGSGMGAECSARSVGTVVAHFPTAVATRSAARGKKAAKRVWG